MSHNGLCGLSWFLIFFLVCTIHQITPAPKLYFLKWDRSYSFLLLYITLQSSGESSKEPLCVMAVMSSAVLSEKNVSEQSELFCRHRASFNIMLRLATSPQEHRKCQWQKCKMLRTSTAFTRAWSCLFLAHVPMWCSTCLHDVHCATLIWNHWFKITGPIKTNKSKILPRTTNLTSTLNPLLNCHIAVSN